MLRFVWIFMRSTEENDGTKEEMGWGLKREKLRWDRSVHSLGSGWCIQNYFWQCLGSIWNNRDQTWVSRMLANSIQGLQDKCSNIALVPMLISFIRIDFPRRSSWAQFHMNPLKKPPWFWSEPVVLKNNDQRYTDNGFETGNKESRNESIRVWKLEHPKKKKIALLTVWFFFSPRNAYFRFWTCRPVREYYPTLRREEETAERTEK